MKIVVFYSGKGRTEMSKAHEPKRNFKHIIFDRLINQILLISVSDSLMRQLLLLVHEHVPNAMQRISGAGNPNLHSLCRISHSANKYWSYANLFYCSTRQASIEATAFAKNINQRPLTISPIWSMLILPHVHRSLNRQLCRAI